MKIWQFKDGTFSEIELGWAQEDESFDDAFERWGFERNASVLYGESINDHIEIHGGTADRGGQYIAVHSNAFNAELIVLPSYPDMIDYLAKVVPIVMAAAESGLREFESNKPEVKRG